MTKRTASVVAALVLGAASPASAVPVDDATINDLLTRQLLAEACARIEAADNRAAYLSTPLGGAYYAASVCALPAGERSQARLASAEAGIAAAQQHFGAGTPERGWVDSVASVCRAARQQQRRIETTEQIRHSWGGKIQGSCAAPSASEFGSGSDAGWIPRSLIGGAAPTEVQDLLRSEHAAPSPRVSVCAPFVAVSATDSDAVCAAAGRFVAYFRGEYGPVVPAAWIAVHHYTGAAEMKAHMQRHGGPPCGDVLGYFDPVSQRIAYRAPAGSYGTLQHETTHALVFWAAPQLPRWFEEGLAALYEHTDAEYHGLPNPWRQALLRGAPHDERDFCGRVLQADLAQLESDPRPATLSREVLRGVQQRGQLGELYRALRAESAVQYDGSASSHSPDAHLVAVWRALPGIREVCGAVQ
jgi:hypothetical protein